MLDKAASELKLSPCSEILKDHVYCKFHCKFTRELSFNWTHQILIPFYILCIMHITNVAGTMNEIINKYASDFRVHQLKTVYTVYGQRMC